MSTFNLRSNKYAAGGIALLLLLLVLHSPLNIFIRSVFNTSPAETLFTSRIYFVLMVAVVWLYAVRKEHTSLLIRKDNSYPLWKHLVLFICLFIVTLIIVTVFSVLYRYSGLTMKSANLQKLLPVLKKYPWLAVFTCITAGVTEELLIRGYLQARLQLIFGRALPAVFISAVIFGAMHYGYGTWYNMLGPFLMGLLFSLFYNRYKNIKVLILVHICWDLLVIFSAMRTIHH